MKSDILFRGTGQKGDVELVGLDDKLRWIDMTGPKKSDVALVGLEVR